MCCRSREFRIEVERALHDGLPHSSFAGDKPTNGHLTKTSKQELRENYGLFQLFRTYNAVGADGIYQLKRNIWVLVAACVASSIVVLAGCGIQSKGFSQSATADPKISLSLSSQTIVATAGSSITDDVTISESSMSAMPDLSVSNLPDGITTTILRSGVANVAQIQFQLSSKTETGTHPVIVTASSHGYSTQVSLQLIVTNAAISIANESIGEFDETSCTALSVLGSTIMRSPGSPDLSQLAGLQSDRVRLQIVDPTGTPQISPDEWNFSVVDSVVFPVLSIGNHSVEFQIAVAPEFMYVPGTKILQDQSFGQLATYAQNLVRYYNTGGFSAPDGFHKSSSEVPIQWWGIYNEPNGEASLTPEQYVDLYNTVVPTMQAADPSLKFVALELGDGGNLNADQTYIPVFVGGVRAQVDAVAVHFYSTWSQRTSDSDIMATIPGFASKVQRIRADLMKNPDLSAVPILITESNINADNPNSDGTSMDNPGQPFVLDNRGSDVFYAAWKPYLFSQLGKAGVSTLCHFNFEGSAQYGQVNNKSGHLQLSYWVDYWLAHYLAKSEKPHLLEVLNSNIKDIEVLAVQNSDNSVLVMIVNHAVANQSDNDGNGAQRTVNINLSAFGDSFSKATELKIDRNTSVTKGPEETSVALTAQMQLELDGYGVIFLKLIA